MKIKNWLTAAALCLASLPGYAGVIYEWQAIKNASPYNFALLLEFDEATVRKGSIELMISRSGVGSDVVFPDSGLLSLRYSLGNLQFPGLIEFFPHVPGVSGPGGETVHMNLTFQPGGTLSGWVFASNSQHQFTIDAQGGNVFTVSDVNSDLPLPACPEPGAYQCSGATGQLKLREVPEPAPLALLAIGWVAALSGKRRRARK